MVRSNTMESSSPSIGQRLKGFISSPTARRKKQRSPKPRRATPPSPEPEPVRNFRERTWSNGQGWGVGGEGWHGDDAPLLPERSYTPDDMGLDEPPPVPDRNYSWSDMEDNDDEVGRTPALPSSHPHTRHTLTLTAGTSE